MALRIARRAGLLLLVATAAWAQLPDDKGFAYEIAPATEPPPTHESAPGVGWALLVGVGSYERSDFDIEGYAVSNLNAPANDVRALEAFLTDEERGRFPKENVITLVDEDAKKDDILFALAELRRQAAPEDLVLFYFSGHGFRPSADGSEAFLVPYVTHPRALASPSVGCIKYEDIMSEVRGIAAQRIVAILDACHSGGVKPRDTKQIE